MQTEIENKSFDVLPFARRVFPGLERYRLDDLRAHLSIGGPSHNAIDDCIATAKVLQAGIRTPDGQLAMERSRAIQVREAEIASKNEADRKAKIISCYWDSMDESCYRCFVVRGGIQYESCFDNVEEILACIETACDQNGGHYYKTAAKKASAAILLCPAMQYEELATYWREQGYKVISPSDFLAYCGHPEILLKGKMDTLREQYVHSLD